MTISFKSIFIVIAVVAISVFFILHQHSNTSSFIELAPGYEELKVVFHNNDQIRG